jgi:nicotinamide riboside kinase
MRIGICGAQSVGKTTLLNALRSEKLLSDIKVRNEVTRRVASYGLPINEHGSDITQKLIMHEHIVNVFMYDNFITDRTALDGVVYSHYLHENGRLTDETMTYVTNIFVKLKPCYDILFYIKPEFDIQNDGIRSVDTNFRDRIVELFDQYIDTFRVPTVLLTGSVRERLDQAIEHIKKESSRQEMERDLDCDY